MQSNNDEKRAAPVGQGGRLDPLYLSGVALQGADRTASAWSKGQTTNSTNDGLLMAAEVRRLDLSGTWLACLSACESGIGLVSDAESMRGLRTAFHVAGADNVLCSLWKADDSYAAVLMAAFYEDSLKSEDLAGALARVQAKELKNVVRGGLWRRVTWAGAFMTSSVGAVNGAP